MNDNALALPDEQTFRHDVEAINKFQRIVHQTMILGQDYGVIPGTGKKPTLLKPGAEKIAKLLGLSDDYEIVDRQENWDKPFFRYLIKCKLSKVGTGILISSGLGECNSMESKYRWRWISERDLPDGTDKAKLVSQQRKSDSGGHWLVYRFENDDIYSQVNTLLKMAKKRALVDAALSAGRLSDVFTQDIEDMGAVVEGEYHEVKVDESKHYCAEHQTNYFKKGKMKGYAHPIVVDGKPTGEWCNEPDETTKPQETEAKPETKKPSLKDIMESHGYTEEEVKAHILDKYLTESLRDLTAKQLNELKVDLENDQVKRRITE